MKCMTCGVEMVERRATTDAPYSYRLSGLSNVYLVGVLVRKCHQCEEESAVIPRIEELHGLLVECIVKRPFPLKGEEIRFMRKQAGLPAKEFSLLLGIDAAHLSRVENGHTRYLGMQTDILARAIVMAATRGGGMAKEVLLEAARGLAREAKKAKQKAIADSQCPLFTLDKKEGWKAAA